jgi:hypothetical protein
MKKGENTSKLHILYEKDSTAVVYVVLDYMTGEVIKVKKISKEFGSLDKILGAYVKQSPKFTEYKDSTFDAIHFVLA